MAAIPANVAVTDSITLKSMYAAAFPYSPPSSSPTVSRLNAENVVKPPQKPVMSADRIAGDVWVFR